MQLVRALQKALIYRRLQQLSAEKITVEGKVTGSNNGGLFVLTEGVSAFCPGSLIPTVSTPPLLLHPFHENGLF